MDAVTEHLNSMGKAFVDFALPMLAQASALIVILLGLDLLLRKRVRAVVRYWILMLVLVKLLLPTTLSSPTGLGYWIGWDFGGIGPDSPSAVGPAPMPPQTPEPPLALARPETELPPPADLPPPTALAAETAAAPVATFAPPVSITWQALALLVWLAAVMGMTAVLIHRSVQVGRLMSRPVAGGPADQAGQHAVGLSEILENCRARLGMKRPVRLKLSARTASPAVCGLFRPVILLPEDLSQQLNSRHLTAVLLHELAHIKRGDLWVNLAQAVLQIAYFYNPLLWLANAVIRRVREQAVDEMVLVAMGESAREYPDTLVNVARLSLTRPALILRLIGVVESKRALAGRIRHILTRPLPRTARLGAIGLMAILIGAAVLLPMAGAGAREGDSPAAGAGKAEESPAAGSWRGGYLDLRVVHRHTKKPLAGVRLKVRARADGRQEKWQDKTDAQGRCRIKLPDRPPESLSIYPDKEGFVPLRVAWEEKPTPAIPRTFTVSLEPGTTIGGLVQNEQGRPIEGVAVCLFYLRPDPAAGPNARVNIWLRELTTDKKGRWRCNFVPAEFDDLEILLKHRDYVSNNWAHGIPMPIVPVPPPAKLRDLTAVMVMKKGPTLAGTVTDAKAKPIPGARVIVGSDRFVLPYPPRKTDRKGRYRFDHLKPEIVVLTVQAKGYAPDLKEVRIEAGLGPVDFKLTPGRSIRGRVVDAKGRPVTGASVEAEAWRGHRSLRWRVRTDAEGRFRWSGAPADAVLFNVYKAGYMHVSARPLTARDEEYVIAMARPLQVRGKVVDAKTGTPIPRFRLIPGIDWMRGGRPSWGRGSEAKTFVGGSYEITFTQPYPARLIRIEAEGYRPAISRCINMDEGEVVVDFKLEKGAASVGVAGVVLGTSGKPLGGAKVVLCTPSEGGYIRNGRQLVHEGAGHLTTGPDGGFAFPAPTETYLVVVLHETGYAEVTDKQLAVSDRIRLEPWGRIEGTLMIGIKPGAGETINVSQDLRAPEPGRPRLFHDIRAITDKEGWFTIDRLPPGRVIVARSVEVGKWTWASQQATKVNVKAGQTVQVALGGMGRPVIGRLVVPVGIEGGVRWEYCYSAISTAFPKLKLPDDWAAMDAWARQQWREQWSRSKQGKALMKAREEARRNRRHFGFRIGRDGSFRVPDVAAGKYQLSVELHEPPKGGGAGEGEVVGLVRHEFTVPQMPGGRSDEPLDLGKLELQLFARVKLGEKAPPFETKTLAGKPLKLTDCRGKVVLLSFWATSWGPCLAETPHLKATYEAFGKDPRFVMIALSLDKDAETTRKYVEKNALKWIQGFLGDWSRTKLPNEYGVKGIPAIFLIGPDGRIFAKDLRGAAIKAAVAKALRQAAPAGGGNRPAARPPGGGAAPRRRAAAKPPVPEGFVAVRVVDADGRPVAGARLGKSVRTRDVKVNSSRLQWTPGYRDAIVTDDDGRALVAEDDLFLPWWPPGRKALLIAIHEFGQIGAMVEVGRKDIGRRLELKLQPLCRVHGIVASPELTKLGRPLRQWQIYLYWKEHTAMQQGLHMFDDKPMPDRFEFLLPPGRYKLHAYGFGKGVAGAGTLPADPAFEVRPGQRELDLGTVNLPAGGLAKLLGKPAPELRQIRKWVNGGPVTLAGLKGKVVLLHFRRSPFRTKELVTLQEKYKAHGLVVIAIQDNSITSAAALRAKFAELRKKDPRTYSQDPTFLIALDGGKSAKIRIGGVDHEAPGANFAAYGMHVSTTSVLIDREGRVACSARPDSGRSIKDLERLLGLAKGPALPGWRKRFDAVYRLEKGEVLKRIAPPFIPEREQYYREEHPSQAQAARRPPDYFTFHWNGKLGWPGLGFTGGLRPLSNVLVRNIGLATYQFEGPRELLQLDVPGDWIVRKDASQAARMKALEQIIRRQLRQPIRLEPRQLVREVAVARGRFQFRPLSGSRDDSGIHIYAEKLDPEEGAGGGSGTMAEFLRHVGSRLNLTVIDETQTGKNERVSWYNNRDSSYGRMGDRRAELINKVFANLSRQTSMEFFLERRKLQVWFVRREQPAAPGRVGSRPAARAGGSK